MPTKLSTFARVLGGIFLLSWGPSQPAAAGTGGGYGVCAAAVAHAARGAGVPADVLQAISLGESGRWDPIRRASVAWPWTVTSGGAGQFLPSKAAAIARVKELQGQGVRNIDVGCMQVNLHYHPTAFADLEAAFDPPQNAAYAAGFLARLHGGNGGSWWPAVGRYHSSTPHLAQRYKAKVARLLGRTTVAAAADHSAARRSAWRAAAADAEADAATRRAAAESRRQQVIAAYLAKRAARQQAGGG